jgi:hypothetical protein
MKTKILSNCRYKINHDTSGVLLLKMTISSRVRYAWNTVLGFGSIVALFGTYICACTNRFSVKIECSENVGDMTGPITDLGLTDSYIKVNDLEPLCNHVSSMVLAAH